MYVLCASYIFSRSLHDLQWYSVDLVVESCVLLQTFLKLHQQCSEVGSSQIQGKVSSILFKIK